MERAGKQKKAPDWARLVDYRPAKPGDTEELLAIEKQSFRTPWSREMFERELSLPFSYHRVAELKDGAGIAGYVFCWLSLPEASIMSIAVRPESRRRRLGEFIMDKTLKDLEREGATEVWLEVRPSNTPARALYRRFGFGEVGVRPRYYSDTGEDAIVMKKEF